MTSDEREPIDNDLPLDNDGTGGAQNEDEEFFVLSFDDEASESSDLDDFDSETTFVIEDDLGGGSETTAPESGDSLFDEPDIDDDLFSDIDAAAQIEAATDDVVAAHADDASMSGEFVLEEDHDGDMFVGLSDGDEDVDARWQEEQEELSSYSDANYSDANIGPDDLNLVETPDSDSVDSDSGESDTFAIDEEVDDFVYSSDEETGEDFVSEAPPLPPPGYRPPVAGDPQDFGAIPLSSLGQDASDLEEQLLGDRSDGDEVATSGNWNAIESDDFDIVNQDADLASGRFAAIDPVREQAPESEWSEASEGAVSHGDMTPHGDASFDLGEPANEEGDYDPIYGKPMPSAAEVAGFAPPESAGAAMPGASVPGDYDHLEEMVQDAVDEPGVAVIGAAPRRRVWLRRFMGVGMAASVLVLGAVAFVTVRPDVPIAKRIRDAIGLNPKSAPALQVANVARPKVDSSFTVPRLGPNDKVATTTPEIGDPKVGDPKTGNPTQNPTDGTEVVAKSTPSARSKRNFESLRAFAAWSGRAGGGLALRWLASRRSAASGTDSKTGPKIIASKTTPGDTQPETGEKVASTGTPPDTGTTKQPVTAMQPENIGEKALAKSGSPEVGRQPATPRDPATPSAATAGKNPPSIAGGPHGWGVGILRGAQAFAQLENGHFFVGRVQKVDESSLLLTWGKAEITFLPGELQKLLPVASKELEMLRGGPQGFVKLKNQNKIWGQILEDLPDVVTIQKGEHRITIPKVAVAQVSKQERATVRLGRNDEDWSEESIPQVEAPPAVSEPKIEPELQSGAVRVRLDMTERSDRLKARVKNVLRAKPLR